MKRILSIFFILFISINNWSQSSIKDLYINWIIEDTQRGKYRAALDNLEKIHEYPEDYVLWLNNLWEEAMRHNADEIANEAGKRLISVPLQYHFYRSLGNCSIIYENQGEYAKSIAVRERQLSLLRNNKPINEEEYGFVLHSIASSYEDLGDQLKADSVYLEALRHFGENYIGNFSLNYMYLISGVANIYERRNEADQELYYRIKAVDLARRFPPSLNLVVLYQQLALVYQKRQQVNKAIDIYEEAQALLGNVVDTTSMRYLRALYNIYGMLALCYKETFDYDKAKPYYIKSIALAKDLYGELSSQYIYDNSFLARIYISEHNTNEAQKIILPMIALLEEQGESYYSYLVGYYSEAAHMCSIALDFESEVQYRKKEAELTKVMYGENSMEYAEALKTYALANYSTYTYDESISCLLKASEIENRLHGKSLRYLEYQVHLASAYRQLGENKQAIATYENILSLCEKISSSDIIRISVLNDLGLVYFNDDFFRAEKYFRDALHLQNNLREDNARQLISINNNLGLLYLHNGMYEESEKYLLEAYRLSQVPFDSIYGFGMGLSYFSILKNLAELYLYKVDISKAKEFTYKALNQCESTNGVDNADYAVLLHLWGDIELADGNFVSAINYYERALAIRKKIFGDNSELCGLTYGAIGSAYHFMGNYTNALAFYEKEKDISIKHKKDLFSTYYNIAFSEWLLHDTKSAVRDINQSINSLEAHIGSFFINLSDKQRVQYWRQYQNTIIEDAYNIAYDAWKSDIRGEEVAYRTALLTKGVLLDVEKQKATFIERSTDSTLKSEWDIYIQKSQQLVTLLSNGNDESNNIIRLKEECEALDKEISERIPQYYNTVCVNDVKKKLPSNAVAIEIIDFTVKRKGLLVTNSDSIMYCALLLRRDSQFPSLIPLFEEKEVFTLVNATSEKQTNFTYSYNGNGKQLSQLVWSKILPHIKQGETIYFAPSGILHQLAIEALPYDSTHTMADMYNLVRLSSTREIVTRKQETQHSSAVLYGGIQYDMDTTIIKKESAKYPEIAMKRSIENDTINRGKIGFLEWTQTEVENINFMLKQDHLQVQLFTSTNANEESFKALSGKHQNILHIATHGFFWSDSTAKRKDYFSQRIKTLDNNMPSPPTIDPLNRCGLLFAGAQMAWSGHSTELPDGVQDGILTAKEISLLDLRDADLVVLSACETGKGEITGDGVFGLQRAFKQAGAQTIIMSLWPVNDIATQLLMTEFYRNWITSNQSKREAFRNAQNSVRSKYQKPVYWAGFIMLD